MRTILRTALMQMAVFAMLATAATTVLCQQEPEPPRNEMSQEKINEILGRIQTQEPEFYDSLMDMKSNEPGRFQGQVMEWHFRQRELEETKKHDPERYEKLKKMYELEKQERSLASKYRLSDDKNMKKSILQQLDSLLEQIFDARLDMQRQEVKNLEQRIAEVKEDIARREENKEMIIQRRLEDLTGESRDLQW